jgi:hypothetical protein
VTGGGSEGWLDWQGWDGSLERCLLTPRFWIHLWLQSLMKRTASRCLFVYCQPSETWNELYWNLMYVFHRWVKRLIKCDCPSDWADAFVVVEHISSSFVPGCPQIPSMDDGLFRKMCCIDSNIPCLCRRTSSTGLSRSRLWRLRQLQPDHKVIVRRYAWTSFDSSRWQSSSIHCYARLDHLQPLPLASLSSLPLLFLLSSHQLATYNFMRNGNQLHEQTTLRMLQASTSSLFWTIKMCLLRQNESSISE